MHEGCSTLRLPNLFIVGAAKSGTTSLHSYLSEHPQVFMASLKEPHFFSRVRPTAKHRNFLPVVTREDDYKKLFADAGAEQIIGEASPSYLWEPGTAQRIYDKVPNAHIVVMLRDPVDRAHSHYLMEYRAGREMLPFPQALRRDWFAEQKGWGVSFLYVELGLYFRQVKRYIDVFGERNISIILFNDFVADPARVLRELAERLGIDTAPIAELNVDRSHNAFELPRSELARRANNNAPVRLLAKRFVPHPLRTYIRNKLFFKEGDKPTFDASSKEFLIERFRDDLDQLEGLLQRDLSVLRRSWS